MNDTDIYADRYRVVYYPERGDEEPAFPPINPWGRVPKPTIRRGGDAT